MKDDALLPPTAEIAPMFAVPLSQARMPGHESINAQLRSLLLARADDPQFANPQPSLKQQVGVFESQFNLFAWPEPPVQKLREFCWTELGRTLQALNGYTAAEMSRLRIYSHTWFHVTRAPGFVIAHTHPMASWSGVYCVAPGGESSAHPESGVLRFHNPHYYSNMFLDPGNARLAAPFHHGTWSVRLRAGQLVLFPSWVSHEVLPFHGTDERITIAFNCWFGMGDGQGAAGAA
ncbi:putative 2OG-Fe(II) oxygenase [Cognatilysobacter lacus]|nr:putative 2OG-Fe(II) oxygenase [Lysobacter lacus]